MLKRGTAGASSTAVGSFSPNFSPSADARRTPRRTVDFLGVRASDPTRTCSVRRPSTSTESGAIAIAFLPRVRLEGKSTSRSALLAGCRLGLGCVQGFPAILLGAYFITPFLGLLVLLGVGRNLRHVVS